MTKAKPRQLAEALRLAPAGMSPFEHAWSLLTTAQFESGLVPHLRLEQIREDSAVSYQETRARAKKQEANNLRGLKPTNPTPNPTPAVHTSAVSKPQYDNQLAVLESSIASLSTPMDTLKRGSGSNSNGKSRDRSTTPARKQRNNRSNNANSNNRSSNSVNNDSTAVAISCNYLGCIYLNDHAREEYGLREAHLERGLRKLRVDGARTGHPRPG